MKIVEPPEEYRHVTVQCEDGKVHFKIDTWQSFCGGTIIYNVKFDLRENDEPCKLRLYKNFLEFLQRDQQVGKLNRSKVFLADKVRKHRFEYETSMYDFCMTFDEFLHGEPMPNPNSGNHVLVFELDRTVFDLNSGKGKSPFTKGGRKREGGDW